jgi:hypothetical protein
VEQGISQVTALVDAYCSSWNEPRPDARLRQLGATLNASCRYCDPRADLVGIQEISRYIGSILEVDPGSIRRTSPLLLHHSVALFKWQRVCDDGRILPEGLDVIELDAKGFILRITGFFGPLP